MSNITYSDIDIFINYQDLYKQFLDVYELKSEFITIDKKPLSDFAYKNGFSRYYKFSYPLVMNQQPKYDTMYIDMLVSSKKICFTRVTNIR